MAKLGIVGVLLAGGQSRRMGGGDKCLRMLGNRTILAKIIERTRPQVSALVLNANGDPARFADCGLPVTPDTVEGFAGPLAGVLAGLDWAAEQTPDDLVSRLLAAIERDGAELACAASDGRTHPVFGLWPVRLREGLRQAMINEDIRKVDRWTARYRLAKATFEVRELDPFFNANRPEDLETAAAWMSRRQLAKAGAPHAKKSKG